MSKKEKEIEKSMEIEKSKYHFVFSKQNYIWMGVGILLIFIGYIMMLGYDANTKPNGVYDPNYWNEDIFSWRRIRLAPMLIIAGFIVEVYAIMLKPSDK